MTHAVKTWKQFFKPQAFGEKLFELRKDDRNYNVGDTFLSQEWDNETNQYTGNKIAFIITYVLRDAMHFGLMKGYCILQLKEKELQYADK